MTKEEIIRATVCDNCIWEDKLDNTPIKMVYKAMDQWADIVSKERAIEFDKWKISNGFKEYYSGIHADIYYIRTITIGDETKHERIAFDIVYNQFIEQQNK